MRTILRCALLGLAIALTVGLSGQARSADKDKAKPKTPSAVDDPDPEGRWAGDKVGQARRYLIFHDNGGWHVHVTSGKKITFNGTSTVADGKVTKVFGFENLEVGKDPKKSDFGQVNAERTRIDFRFVTHGGEDSFSFKVSDKATYL